MAGLTLRLRPEWLGLAASGTALAVAHAAQWSGLVPCALCYLERWPYRLAALLAVVAIGWARGRLVLLPLLTLSFVAAAALAWVHVGVEAGWWKSPLPECAAPVLRTGSIRDLLNSMPARPSKPCDSPTLLVSFLPVSMAQLNLAYALVVAALLPLCKPAVSRPVKGAS